jgi:outer membrane factor, OMF family
MKSSNSLVSLGLGAALAAASIQPTLAQAASSPQPKIQVAQAETPAAPAPVEQPPASSAADLIRLNPNPDPLSLPTQAEQVRINVNQPITLQQALQLSRRNNRDLQVLELQLQQSRASLRQAEAALYPTMTLSTSVSRSASFDAPQTDFFGTTTFVDSASNNAGATFQFGYNVFTSGQRSASITIAKEQVRAAELALARQAEELRLDTISDYYDIQQADALVRIAEAAVANSEISLRDALARERAGLGTRFEVLQAEVQRANNRQQLNQTIARQRVARRVLAQRLSVANTIDLRAADPIQIAGRWVPSLEESIVMGLKNRVELQEQLLQRKIALQQRRIAKANLGPQFAVGGQFTTSDEITDEFLPQWGYSVNGQLSMTIFDGGAARASAKQQETSVAIAETQFASFKNLIRYQIEQAYYTLQSSFDNIQTNRVAVEQATEGLRLARLRFQAGVGTQSDVIDAETRLTRAQGDLLSATVDYNRALASLQRFVSGLPLVTPSVSQPAPAAAPQPAP